MKAESTQYKFSPGSTRYRESFCCRKGTNPYRAQSLSSGNPLSNWNYWAQEHKHGAIFAVGTRKELSIIPLEGQLSTSFANCACQLCWSIWPLSREESHNFIPAKSKEMPRPVVHRKVWIGDSGNFLSQVEGVGLKLTSWISAPAAGAFIGEPMRDQLSPFQV